MGDQGERRIYNSTQKAHHWPHITSSIYKTVRNCCRGTGNQPAVKPRQPLQLFPLTGSLTFVTTDILVPLANPSNGSQFVLVGTDHYLNLARAVLTSKITPFLIASLFMNHWLVPSRIPICLLVRNRTQIIWKLFKSQSLSLNEIHINYAGTTQRKVKAKQFYSTMSALLWRYVADHQGDWDLYVLPVAYEYCTRCTDKRK